MERTTKGEKGGVRDRGIYTFQKLRQGLWGFNCTPRLWLESSKTPFAADFAQSSDTAVTT